MWSLTALRTSNFATEKEEKGRHPRTRRMSFPLPSKVSPLSTSCGSLTALRISNLPPKKGRRAGISERDVCNFPFPVKSLHPARHVEPDRSEHLEFCHRGRGKGQTSQNKVYVISTSQSSFSTKHVMSCLTALISENRSGRSRVLQRLWTVEGPGKLRI